MIERKITNTIKDESGKIIALANPVEWWSPRMTTEVINDIEETFYEYYLLLDGKKVLLKIMNGKGEKHLRTDPNLTNRNKLVDLPGF